MPDWAASEPGCTGAIMKASPQLYTKVPEAGERTQDVRCRRHGMDGQMDRHVVQSQTPTSDGERLPSTLWLRRPV